jgi:hypothetical protein
MSKLTPPQLDVLNSNTLSSIENGFAVEYHAQLKDELERAESFRVKLEANGDPYAETMKTRVTRLGSALMAEAPIAFFTEPSNMAASIVAKKVNSETGEVIDGTDIQIGLVGGLAQDGQPSSKFEGDYLKFAVERVRVQEKIGLHYGSSVYLPN